MPVTPACRARGQLPGQLFGGQRNHLRPPANGLRERFVQVAPGSQRGHLIAVGKLLNDGEGALADGAGGTENGESLQGKLMSRLTDSLIRFATLRAAEGLSLDVAADCIEVGNCRGRPANCYFGAGNSFSVPQLSSHSITRSFETPSPASNSARPARICCVPSYRAQSTWR
jgi:hypothetical protein